MTSVRYVRSYEKKYKLIIKSNHIMLGRHSMLAYLKTLKNILMHSHITKKKVFKNSEHNVQTNLGTMFKEVSTVN